MRWCPKCGKPMCSATGQYGEFIACSGYPKVQVREAGAAGGCVPEVRRRRCGKEDQAGRYVLWCVNYPKCDFSSNQKMVNEVCPKCDSAYLMELANAKGNVPGVPEPIARRCPSGDRRRARKVVAATTPECGFQKKIGPPAAVPVLELPDPEKTRAVVESVA